MRKIILLFLYIDVRTLIIKIKLKNYCVFFIYFEDVTFFYFIQCEHRESIVIGLAASSTSKGPQVKTTEPMVSSKVRN